MTDWLTFDVTIHARPERSFANGTRTECISVSGEEQLPVLAIASNQLLEPFDVSFEQAEAALNMLPRMHCELDGSFVFSGEVDAQRWQVDGHLYDRNERLLYVALHGRCPSTALDRLLRAFGWPDTELVFQLQRESVVVEEETFRRFASASI